MKKLLITLLISTFCWTAFAIDVPQQDTTKRRINPTRQDTVRRPDTSKVSNKKTRPLKSKNPKKKNPSKSRDTTRKNQIDTNGRGNQP